MKTFSEVFPGFQAEEPLLSLLKLLEVERISAAGDFSALKIDLICPRLIEWKLFRNLEQEMAFQLFPGKKLKITIRERYRLQEQFSPETIFTSMQESLFAELSGKSLMEYRMLKKAEISFPAENCMEFTVEDMALNRRLLPELKSWLQEEVFGRRFGLSLEVRPRLIPYVMQEREDDDNTEALPVRAKEEAEEAFLIADPEAEGNAAGGSGGTGPASGGSGGAAAPAALTGATAPSGATTRTCSTAGILPTSSCP